MVWKMRVSPPDTWVNAVEEALVRSHSASFLWSHLSEFSVIRRIYSASFPGKCLINAQTEQVKY